MVNQIVENYDYSSIPAQELDAIRMKLSQLTSSLNKIKEDVSKPIEFQQWHSLNAKITLLLTQLSSLNKTLHHYEYVLNSLIVYPLPNFPTTAHEGLLTTLLRKKNIPEVDEWITSCRLALSTPATVQARLQEDDELSQWCLDTLRRERNKIFNSSKNRDDIEDEEDEDEDMYKDNFEEDVPTKVHKKQDVFKIIPPAFDTDNVFKFMYTGAQA